MLLQATNALFGRVVVVVDVFVARVVDGMPPLVGVIVGAVRVGIPVVSLLFGVL